MSIAIKRVYEPAAPSDGFRILIDRIWPRGLTKDQTHIDLWLKDLAPSTALRKWFNHDPSKWEEFRTKYLSEIESHPDEIALVRKHIKQGLVTLVYAAKDTEHSNAAVLKEYFQNGA